MFNQYFKCQCPHSKVYENFGFVRSFAEYLPRREVVSVLLSVSQPREYLILWLHNLMAISPMYLFPYLFNEKGAIIVKTPVVVIFETVCL